MPQQGASCGRAPPVDWPPMHELRRAHTRRSVGVACVPRVPRPDTCRPRPVSTAARLLNPSDAIGEPARTAMPKPLMCVCVAMRCFLVVLCTSSMRMLAERVQSAALLVGGERAAR